MMSNIVWLLWINLAGASVLSCYGILIGVCPVVILNGFIVLIDLYHLHHMYFRAPKLKKITYMHATAPYIVDILSLKWPALSELTEDAKVKIIFEGSEPKSYEIIY
jgi:hypothetical protein